MRSLLRTFHCCSCSLQGLRHLVWSVLRTFDCCSCSLLGSAFQGHIPCVLLVPGGFRRRMCRARGAARLQRPPPPLPPGEEDSGEEKAGCKFCSSEAGGEGQPIQSRWPMSLRLIPLACSRQHSGLRVGSACSGWCSEVYALRRLGKAFTLCFACDIDKKVKTLLRHTMDHHHWYDAKSFQAAPTVDLFFAGFPCMSTMVFCRTTQGQGR